MVKMANNMIPRRSDLFDMTPFNFFEDFGRNFLKVSKVIWSKQIFMKQTKNTF